MIKESPSQHKKETERKYSRRSVLAGAFRAAFGIGIAISISPVLPSNAGEKKEKNLLTTHSELQIKWQKRGLAILDSTQPIEANPIIQEGQNLAEASKIISVDLRPEIASLIDELLEELPVVRGYIQRLIIAEIPGDYRQPVYGTENKDVGRNFVDGVYICDIDDGKITQDVYMWIPPDIVSGKKDLDEEFIDERYFSWAGGNLVKGMTYREVIKAVFYHECFHSFMWALIMKEIKYDQDLLKRVNGRGLTQKEGNPLMRAYFTALGAEEFRQEDFKKKLVKKTEDLLYTLSEENLEAIKISSAHRDEEWEIFHPTSGYGDPRIRRMENIPRSEWRNTSVSAVFGVPHEAIAEKYAMYKLYPRALRRVDTDFFQMVEDLLRDEVFPDGFFSTQEELQQQFPKLRSLAELRAGDQ